MLEYTVSVLCRVVKDAALGMEDKVGSERENKKDEGDDAQKDKAAEEKELKKNISNTSESEWNATVPTLVACARWFMEKRERKTDDASRRDGKKQKQRNGKKGGMHAKWYSAYHCTTKKKSKGVGMVDPKLPCPRRLRRGEKNDRRDIDLQGEWTTGYCITTKSTYAIAHELLTRSLVTSNEKKKKNARSPPKEVYGLQRFYLTK